MVWVAFGHYSFFPMPFLRSAASPGEQSPLSAVSKSFCLLDGKSLDIFRNTVSPQSPSAVPNIYNKQAANLMPPKCT